MASQGTSIKLSQKECEMLCEIFNIDDLLRDDEECEMLKEQNPELFDLYLKLSKGK